MIKNLLKKALFVLGIFVASQSIAQSTYTINVGDGGNLFVPANVTCLVGDTIKFVWVSGFHPTQSTNGTTIPLVNMDGSGGVNSVYKIKMLTAGTVPYECTAHGGMTGIITVNAPVSNSPIITENFNYTLNDTLSNISGAGWTPIATVSTINKIPVVAGLTYSGSTLSNIGNAANIKNTGQDIGKVFPGSNIRSGSIYTSFLMNVSAAQANGDYFFAYLDSALNGTNYRARTFIKSSGTGYRIGVSKSGANSVAGYNSTDLVFGTTYQVVVKYSIIAGTANDSVKIFVNPTLGAPEPAATASAVTTENDITISSTVGIGAIALRQGGSTAAPTLTIDGILIGATWASVTPLASVSPSVSFNPTSLTVNENAGTATVTVNLTNPNANPTSATVLVKSGTATSGSDYTFTSQTVMFPANSSTAQTFTFPIIDDTNTEADETIVLALRNATNSASVTTDSILTITIPANDAVNPSVLFNPTSLTVNENAGTATVTVNITNPNASATSATVLVKGGTATSSSDYTFTSQTVTFPANSSTAQTFTFPIIDDTNTEGDETIVLALRNATNSATITTDSILTITIPANDAVINNNPVLIENFNYVINDTLTKNPASGWGVVSAAANRVPVAPGLTYPNHAGSGLGNGALLKTSGEDIGKAFTGNQIRTGSAYASFLMNVTSAQATGDYFFAMLDSALSGLNYRARTFIKSSGTGYRIGITKSGAAAAAVYNTTDLTFGTTYHVVLKYSIIPGTGNDSVKLFLDPVLGAPEPAPTASAVTTETDLTITSTVGIGGIALRQGGATNAASLTVDGIRAGQTWASVTPFTILNPSVVFNPTTLTVNEDAGTATVTVNLANQNANPTSVNVVVKGGTANGAGDYTFTSQTVTFPANSNTPQSFTFPITNDAAMEPDETIILALRNVNNSGTIGSDSILTITIPANDFAGAVVHFTSTSATINENAGNAQMSVMVMGAGTTSSTSFDVVVKSGTATAGSDYTYSTTTYTIPAAKDSTLVITVPVINDAAPEADETAVFAIRNITNSGTISTDSVFTLTIKNDDIAFKNISALKVNDVNGVSVLKDSAVYIKGIVYGVDMQGSATSLQYTLIDPTGGVGIFRAGANNPPIISLVPEEGDSVKVYGKVGEFNGLTQVNMDSIILVSKGNALKAPKVITRLDETTESDLVRFNNAQIIDTIANSGSGTTLRIVSGTDSMDLRIDADVNLFGQPFPSQKFDIIGLGGQFDNSNPKNSGYQLLPRSINDLIAIVTPNAALDSASYSVSEATGTKSIKIVLSSPANDPVSIKVTLTGGSATFTQDYNFTNPTVVNIPAGQSEGTFTFSIINDNTAEQNETINFSLSEATNCILTTPAGTLTILDNDGIGMNINKNIVANIYPNPTKEVVNVESTEIIKSVEIVNIIGQSMMSISQIQSNEKSIDVSSLAPGVYNVVITTDKGNSVKRLVIE